MVGPWQLFLMLHVVLFIICIILLINLKTSSVIKILWVIPMFFILWIGNICFLIWRSCQIRKTTKTGR